MGPELCWGREFKQSPSKQAGEHTCIDCFLSDLDWAYGITVSSPHCLDFPTMVDDTRELSANINTFSPKLLYSGYFLTATEIILELLSWNSLISLSDLRWCTQRSWQTITDFFFCFKTLFHAFWLWVLLRRESWCCSDISASVGELKFPLENFKSCFFSS